MNSRLALEEISKVTKLSKELILDWEKKSLITSEKTFARGRTFDIKQVVNLQKKFAGGKPTEKYKVNVVDETKHTVIELFSGAGGLALGLSNAGLKTKLLVENDRDAVKTLRRNRPQWEVIEDDIQNVKFGAYKGKIDVVAGGFPCQTFSYAGNRKGFGETRGTLFFEFARCVDEVRPKIALAENVRGLIKHDDGRTLKTIISTLEELGYRVAYKMLRAQFFDVAQKRERLFILGVRKDLNIPFLFPRDRDYSFTLRDVLKDCPKSDGATYPERKHYIMSQVPEGGYWRNLPIDLQKEYMKGSFYLGGGKTGMARRLSWSEPSLTLVCTPAQGQTERCHPSETRPLQIRESARIQSFPDSWQFEGSIASQYKQIGNAVPVNLAYYVGRCLAAMLSGKVDKETMVVYSPSEKQFEWGSPQDGQI